MNRKLDIEYYENASLPLRFGPLPMEKCCIPNEDGKWKLDTKLTAQSLVARYSFITLVDNKEIYIKIFENGNYEPYGERWIDIELSRSNLTEMNPYRKGKIITEIKNQTYIKREELAEVKYPDWINLKNGFFNLKSFEFILRSESQRHLSELFPEQSKENIKKLWDKQIKCEEKLFFFTQIPVFFDHNASCPNFDNFLSNILEEQDIKAIWEWIGYCLYSDHSIQKALMLIGGGENGKSTLLLVVQQFLGEMNITSSDIYKLTKERFMLAELYMKKAIFMPDLPSDLLKSTGIFKQLTGGDILIGERKKKDPFYFRNTAKILISANNAPKILERERTFAFLRRWNIILFNKRIPKSEQILQTDLVKQLTTKEELSGILNKALRGLERLMENKDFSNSESVESINDLWVKISDSALWYANEVISFDKDQGIMVRQTDLFDHYKHICKEEKIPSVTQNYFTRCCKNVANLTFKRKQKDGIKESFFLNTFFNDSYSDKYPFVDNLNESKLKGPSVKSSKPNLLDSFIDPIANLKEITFAMNDLDTALEYVLNNFNGDRIVDKSTLFDILQHKFNNQEEFDNYIDNKLLEGIIFEPIEGKLKLS